MAENKWVLQTGFVTPLKVEWHGQLRPLHSQNWLVRAHFVAPKKFRKHGSPWALFLLSTSWQWPLRCPAIDPKSELPVVESVTNNPHEKTNTWQFCW